MKREIINIDEEKCTGCELCIPNCPEGAIQIIDGKARLTSPVQQGTSIVMTVSDFMSALSMSAVSLST